MCCVCTFASLLFAEEVICKSLLSASLQGRDKLHERLWRLACLISFPDKLECTFVINTRSSLADSITPKLADIWLPQRMIVVIRPAFPPPLLLFFFKFYPFYHYHLKIHTEQIYRGWVGGGSAGQWQTLKVLISSIFKEEVETGLLLWAPLMWKWHFPAFQCGFVRPHLHPECKQKTKTKQKPHQTNKQKNTVGTRNQREIGPFFTFSLEIGNRKPESEKSN